MPTEAPSRAAAAPPLRLFLLGRFAAEREGVPVPPEAWRRRRASELLRLLALAPGRAMHREAVIDRLWPDKDLEGGANNLHRALYDLRQVLGGAWVRLEGGVVRLDPAVWIDAEAFAEQARDPDPGVAAAALDLYAGDLCPDDPYAPDLAAHRERLRQSFIDAALAGGRRALAGGRLPEAVAILRRLLEVDPLQEEAHRLLMRALAESGRRQDALRQFEVCADALRRELGAAPSPPTVELHRSLLAGEAVRPAGGARGWQRVCRRLLGTAAPPPLRGRAAALAEIEEICGGEGGVLVLVGEAGVGKTRLAVEAARAAETRGAVLLSGAALEPMRPRGGAPGWEAPYAVFIEAWEDHLRVAGLPATDNPFLALAAAPQAAGAQLDKLRLFRAVRRSLEQLGGGGRVALVLDDLHLCDEPSLHLLHYLAHAARTQALTLVATCREEEVRAGQPLHTLLAALWHERLARRLQLERLDAEATRAQIADLLGREPDAETLAAVLRLTGGNPFYTEEVVAALEERAGPPPERGAAAAVPEDVAAGVRERIAQLGEGAQELLRAAAALGPRFRFDHARRAAGLPSGAALDALDAGLAALLLEEDRSSYRFRHELVREAVYGAMTPARRQHLERRLAAAVEDGEAPGDDPEKPRRA